MKILTSAAQTTEERFKRAAKGCKSFEELMKGIDKEFWHSREDYDATRPEVERLVNDWKRNRNET